MTFVMVLLHLAAALWAPVALFVTVPLHLVVIAVRGRRPAPPSPTTHCRCPDCRELVLLEARVCKHCGCRLIPQSEQIT